jgi:beta-glucanase (GH16 family)
MTVIGLFTLVVLVVAITAGTGGAALRAKKATATGPAPIVASNAAIPQTTTSDGKTDCGGVTMLKSDGTPWVCTFDDEFDGTTLNTNNWQVETTATNGYHSGSECYLNSPNLVSVSGGTLNLSVRKVAAFKCPDVGTTDYQAGMVDSDGLFSQTYGYFEVKAKLPPATVAGLQTSLWLWPVNSQFYGKTWPDSGEIDIAEWYSQFPTLEIPYIHYVEAGGKNSDPDVTNDKCTVSDITGYNTYAAVWTPQSITILMDGQTCLVDSWNPASPEVKPDPFNMPFFINLTAAMGINTNTPSTATAKELPATSNIDWVRAWS